MKSWTKLAGDSTNACSNSSIQDFVVLKNFSVVIHPPKPKLVNEVLWCPPLYGWIEVNINGASGGLPLQAAYGGILKTTTMIIWRVLFVT